MQFQENTPYDVLTEKWNPVLNHAALAPISDDYRKKVTAVLLENQEQAIRTQHLTEDMSSGNFGGPSTSTNYNQGQVSGYDPVLISLVRRSMPNLMAYDICGVQPMTAPTGLIFAMRTQYGAASGTTYGNNNYMEALFQEPLPQYGGSGYTLVGLSAYGVTGGNGLSASFGISGQSGGGTAWALSYQSSGIQSFNALRGMLTNYGEGIGSGSAPYNAFNQMSFSIDRVAVQARTRALRSKCTVELAQDLKAVHG